MNAKAMIYKITNKVNGKIYIGQTIHDLEKRWKEHKRHARQNRSNKSHAICNSIVKYGAENFTIESIFSIFNINDADEFEIYFISKFNTLAPNGLNLSPGGSNVTHTSEVKRKISKKIKELWNSSGHSQKISKKIKELWNSSGYRQKISKANSIPITGHCITSGVEVSFPSIKIAGEVLNINARNISAAIKGVRRHVAGYIWRLANQEFSHLRPLKKRGPSRRRVPITGINCKTGEVRNYPYIRAAVNDGFLSCGICVALKSKNKTYKGWVWSYGLKP
jgi:group I intron endonuclease